MRKVYIFGGTLVSSPFMSNDRGTVAVEQREISLCVHYTLAPVSLAPPFGQLTSSVPHTNAVGIIFLKGSSDHVSPTTVSMLRAGIVSDLPMNCRRLAHCLMNSRYSIHIYGTENEILHAK